MNWMCLDIVFLLSLPLPLFLSCPAHGHWACKMTFLLSEVGTSLQPEYFCCPQGVQDREVFAVWSTCACIADMLSSTCGVPYQDPCGHFSQVMLTKNISVQRNLVNGARGVVRGFESTKGTWFILGHPNCECRSISCLSYYSGHPIVRFVSGLEEIIHPEKWTVRIGGGNTASRRQLPLKLAWAISIHKSQVSFVLVT